MSAKTTKLQSEMQISFKTGVDTKGNDIIKKQNFSKVKVAAIDDDILAVGTAIGNVLKYSVSQIERIDTNSIING